MSESALTHDMHTSSIPSPDGQPQGASLADNAPERPLGDHEVVFRATDVDFYYGKMQALSGVNVAIRRNEITALIGPSGCGKSTFLRCLNRMNDLIPGTRIDGRIDFHGEDLYATHVDSVDVRRRIGMVFQKPNPFPKSIKENLTFGMKVNGIRATDEKVEAALRAAALWDEVKDKLNQDAFALSGGQQQRL